MDIMEFVTISASVLRKMTQDEEIFILLARSVGIKQEEVEAFAKLLFRETLHDAGKFLHLSEEKKYEIAVMMCRHFFESRDSFVTWARANLSVPSTRVMVEVLWSAKSADDHLSLPAQTFGGCDEEDDEIVYTV